MTHNTYILTLFLNFVWLCVPDSASIYNARCSDLVTAHSFFIFPLLVCDNGLLDTQLAEKHFCCYKCSTVIHRDYADGVFCKDADSTLSVASPDIVFSFRTTYVSKSGAGDLRCAADLHPLHDHLVHHRPGCRSAL